MGTIAPVIVKVSDRKLIERLMSNPIKPTRLFLTIECQDGERITLFGWPVDPDAMRSGSRDPITRLEAQQLKRGI